MEIIKLNIEGMSCVNCARAIEIGLKELKGVGKVRVNFELGRAEVEIDPSLLSEEDIKEVIESLGYRVVSVKAPKSFEGPILILCLGASLTIVVLMFLPVPYNHFWQFVLTTLVQVIGGLKFYRGAYHALRVGIGNMDVLVSLGVTSAYLYSVLAWLKVLPGEPFFETSAFLITFVRLGKYLEERSKGKALSLLKDLFALQSSKVTVITPKGEKEVLVKDLLPGDIILLKPGDVVPIDAKIMEGSVSVNESLITGESLPVLKKVGDPMVSGSIVLDGVVKLEVERLVQQSFLAQLLKQVEEAISFKPKMQRLADKISHYFVQTVVLVALLVFLFWFFSTHDILKSFNFTLAVLVISCPCAFGIAIPLALSMGLLRCYRLGVVVKNPEAFERAQKIKAILLDKTGTLTLGKPEVIHLNSNLEEKKLLDLAFALASLSKHPYAKAIAEYAKGRGAERVHSFKEIKEIPGLGIKADSYFLGRSEETEGVVLKDGDTLLGEFFLEDPLRDEAKDVIEFLQAKKIEVFLLSGDASSRVEKVAKLLGIKQYFGKVKPEGKLAKLKEIEAKLGPTAMVGDGLNDAPALAQASLSFVMGEGMDLSKRVGDVILLSGIKGLKNFFIFAEKTSQRVKQNLFWAFIYNLLGIPVAAGVFSHYGIYLKPELAGLMMVFSSLSVVLNSIRK